VGAELAGSGGAGGYPLGLLDRLLRVFGQLAEVDQPAAGQPQRV